MKYILSIILMLNFCCVNNQNLVAQNSPCFPFPMDIKNLPKGFQDHPELVKMIESTNNNENFKKSQDIFLNNEWRRTSMLICKGVTLNITITPLTGDSAISLDGSVCTTSPREPKLKCNSVIGRIGSGEPFQVGSKYVRKANTTGELSLEINCPNSEQKSIHCNVNISITLDEPCSLGEGPQVNDVIIYWKDGIILHSGYVALVGGCKVYAINSSITNRGPKIQNEDDKELTEGNYNYGYKWTVYHRDRKPGDNGVKLIKADYPMSGKGDNRKLHEQWMGETDRGKNGPFILFKRFDNNCHGFTFENKSPIFITGYMFPNGEPHFNLDPPDIDQSTAVKFILRENGYHQVHSIGLMENDVDHYRAEYDVKRFKLPGDLTTFLLPKDLHANFKNSWSYLNDQKIKK